MSTIFRNVTIFAFMSLAAMPARSETVRLVLPYSASPQQRAALGAFAETLDGQLQEPVEIVQLQRPLSYPELIETYRDLQRQDRGDLYVTGFSQGFTESLYQDNAGFRPQWASSGVSPEPDKGFADDGIIILGAGWNTGNGRAPVLSVPARSGLSLPLITMSVLASDPNASGTGDGTGISTGIADLLFGTDAGREVVKAFALVPNLPVSFDAQIDPELFGTLTVKVRPDWTEDGDRCGCDDDEMSALMSCDPDGMAVESLSRMQLRDGRAYLSQETDDDPDSCDPCEESRIQSFQSFRDRDLAELGARFDWFGDSSSLTAHVEDLAFAAYGENRPVFVMSCDPD